MDVHYKDIILKILDAIDFSEDKEKYVGEFLELTKLEALMALVQSLGPEEQEKIKGEFSVHAQDPQKIHEIFTTHFSEGQIKEASEKAAENAIIKWMRAIESTLSDAQRQKLAAFPQELQNASLTK